MDTDPIIDEIREVRHRISERFGHDPKRLVEHYMELQRKKYGDRLLRPKEFPSRIEDVRTGTGGCPEAQTSLEWLAGYYHLERYLFEVVHRRFHTEHSIVAFDFFSIVVWKANRAKSKIARKLLAGGGPGENDLETIVRRLTSCLYRAPDGRERLRLLSQDWRFRLPVASAVLTVFWPEEFTVYDVRVCGQLDAFQQLAHRTNFDRLWKGYRDYIDAVNSAIPGPLSLRDKDRCLWARSAAAQLSEDITSRFTDSPD